MVVFPSRVFDGAFVATSTREGGVSEHGYASLNIGFAVYDNPKAVCENRRRLFAGMGIPLERAVYAEQTHSTNVYHARESDKGRGAYDAGSAIPDTDALITNIRLLPLVIQTADCLPVVIVDEKTRSIAAIHAGWKGLSGGIIENALRAMHAAFHAHPSTMKAYLSVCIAKHNYETSEDVAQWFPLAEKNENGKFFVDLRAEAARRLIAEGVPENAIERSERDTFSESNAFYSYRRDGKTTGRMATVAMLV